MSGATPRRRRLAVHRLGRVPYGPTHTLQKRLQAARSAGAIGDTLLVLEHDPVVTLGRGTHPENLLLSREALAARGVEVHEAGRGGDVTYHGPGQLVLYPIVDLSPDRQDVRRYVSDLEETMIRTCARFGVQAARVPGMNGAWVAAGTPGARKIGAVGVRISRWVTLHGLALNVSTDLDGFSVIVPCGIRDHGVTSLVAETGRELAVADAADVAVEAFADALDADVTSDLRGPPAVPEADPATAG